MQKKTHLKEFEREKIEYWLRLKMTVGQMADKLGRNHSVISREISRNRGPDGRYLSRDAQRRADARRERRKGRKLERDGPLHDWVVAKLRGDGMKQGWAPHVIAGRLKKYPELVDDPEVRGKTVSHEAIYRYIYEGEGRWEGLYHLLPHRHSKRKGRKGRKRRQQSKIPERVSIHERSTEAGARKRAGDWESDTAEGTGKACLSVQADRRFRTAHLHKTADKTKGETEQAIRKTIESYPEHLQEDLFKTMTFDNGGEGTDHGRIRDSYNIDTYFCDPYCSWQKGTVENLIGLIRLRFIPKKTDLSTLSDREISDIESFLNCMPRKSLGYLSPNEALEQYLKEAVHY